ncbi:prepilin peptidase [Jidongwangia harbinensis]|uniref:prepilin peptidase n=1 Tax=Jidongwangia harbinensis TaxID=2878561 RepID=UPI001CD971FC|nr:prepilin peptidase [Jidongwangia harbinensis]MCA2212684.1 prepilin peptidase [Jidongwangia harbinensis]
MLLATGVGAALFGAAAAAWVFPGVRPGAASRRYWHTWRAVPVGAAAAGGLGAVAGPSPLLPVLMTAVVLGLRLAEADLRSLRLPDPLVGALAAVVVVPVVLPGGGTGWWRACLAAALAGLGHLGLALLPGDGLGLGDVKLATVLAFLLGWFGWPTLVAGLVLPHLINGPVAIWLLLRRRAGRRTPLPFGPALLAGAALAVPLTVR